VLSSGVPYVTGLPPSLLIPIKLTTHSYRPQVESYFLPRSAVILLIGCLRGYFSLSPDGNGKLRLIFGPDFPRRCPPRTTWPIHAQGFSGTGRPRMLLAIRLSMRKLGNSGVRPRRTLQTIPSGHGLSCFPLAGVTSDAVMLRLSGGNRLQLPQPPSLHHVSDSHPGLSPCLPSFSCWADLSLCRCHRLDSWSKRHDIPTDCCKYPQSQPRPALLRLPLRLRRRLLVP
jgi:hypothetical protein